MNTKRDVLMVIVALAAGLVGGLVSSELLRGAPIFAQKAPQLEKVLQAERFEVVDQAGKLRAALTLMPNGSPGLELYDQAGKPRAVLVVQANGSPGLELYDQAGEFRAVLGLIDGEPSLQLYDPAGERRAALGYTVLKNTRTGATETRAVSSLVFADKDGKVIWQAP